MTLDPTDWDEFSKTASLMLDASVDKMRNATTGRVWTALPQDKRAMIETELPVTGNSAEQLQEQLSQFLPYGVGNTHPRFFGWVHGAGAPAGLLSEIAAAAMNVNAGGRDHVAPIIERQVIKWSTEIMGFPEDSSGLIVSGTSVATIIALKTARDLAVEDARNNGVPQGHLIGYTSAQTHSCVAQAFDILGLGKDTLRKIDCNDALEMDTKALQAAIIADRKAGLQPFLIVGTAGAVNMGAIDDLETIADIARDEKLWFHIDGAFGATAIISKHARARLTGLARADSLAFDFHKWLQVNYDAGCVLIRNEQAHRNSFSDRPEYLRGAERGLAGGAFWAVDYGPELSRGFRALKVWTHLKHYGIAALSEVIDRNIEQAQYLEGLIKSEPKLEMLAPVPLNICCFRYRFNTNDQAALNEEIVVRLQESGIAVPSTTIINEEFAIRVNLTNHRTRNSDLDLLVKEIIKLGDELR